MDDRRRRVKTNRSVSAILGNMSATRRPERRSTQSAEAITEAAMELCLEVGYNRLSIEGIASRAGVGKQTIYRWWPSKGAVLLDALLARMELDGAFPDTGDIVADLKTQQAALIDTLGGPEIGPHYRALIGEAQHNPDLKQALHDRLIGPLTAAGAARIRRAQEQGQINPDHDPDIIVELLYGAVYHRWLLQQQPIDAGHIHRTIDTAFAGLGPRHDR